MIKVRKLREDLITARPKGMGYEKYRVERKKQERMLKDRLRYGYMVWPSKGIAGVENRNGQIIPVQNKGTLVGKVPQMIFVK